MAESFGVAGRGSFYDAVGAVRDIVQNHLLQVVALLAMEPPVAGSADALRDEKVKVIRAMRPVDPTRLVRGQFVGYRDEAGVAPGSTIETFAALRLAPALTGSTPPHSYARGTWGPAQAEVIGGQHWYGPTG
jgi:glucose-6-phosphate 1-dehydrogenase